MRTIKDYLAQVDDVISKGEIKDNWQSLSSFKIPEWYRKGKFGIFIHWGAYSVPAHQSEWYPRLMYLPDEESCKHKNEHYGENCEYRQIVEKFNPDKFNAEEWVELFKKSGAKYIMPVGEHHDGVKMYESELNRWNMMELIPHRNFSKELHEACDKYGLGFLMSNHRAEHFWYMNGAVKNFPKSEAHDEKYRDLYGPCFIGPSGDIYDNDLGMTATTEWLEDWLASACEMIDKNRPLAVYFDWWIYKNEFRPYLKKFLAYYYNRAVEWGIEAAVFYKWGSVMQGCAIFDVERGQIEGVSPSLWQCDTAIAKNSWGFTENNNFKTPYEVITNFIDVASKNGCFMLNVGPRADGTICEEEKAVLIRIGEWLKVNGEAIFDTIPFQTYGEGNCKIKGSFVEEATYSDEDYRFTYRTGVIYAFPMSITPRDTFSIKSLKFANEGGIRYEIQTVELIGYNEGLRWEQNSEALTLTLDKKIESDMPLCFKVIVE